MNYTDAEIKFCLCFGMQEETLRIQLHIESFFSKKGIEVEEFKDLMIRHRMKEYTNQLLACFYQYSESAILNKYEQIEIDEFEKICPELIKTLIFLFSNENGKNNSLTFSKSKKSFTTKDQDIIDVLINRLIEELGIYFPESKDFPKNGSDLDFVKLLQSYYDKFQIKPGAKSKNTLIADYGWHLAWLKKIDRFLNQNVISDFAKFPFNNEDYRFIHDCLAFFGMIEDKSKNSNNSTPEKYIRTLLKQIGTISDKGELESINSYKAQKENNINKGS